MNILGHLSLFLFVIVIASIYFVVFVITEDYDSIFRMLIRNREDYIPLYARDFWTIFVVTGIFFAIIEIFYWITVLFYSSINL